MINLGADTSGFMEELNRTVRMLERIEKIDRDSVLYVTQFHPNGPGSVQRARQKMRLGDVPRRGLFGGRR